jgi:hypothetical protein
MRREIVATRRAGVTTSVIKRIPPKGKQRACVCLMHRIKSIMATLNFEKLEQRKQLDHPFSNSAKISNF